MALDTTKAGKLLAMLGSEHDGEALAALRKLAALLKSSGQTFTALAKRLGMAKLAKPLQAAAQADGEAAAAELANLRKLVRSARTDFTALAMKLQGPQPQPAAPAASAGPTFHDIFHGFDDWMEERHPGHKAEQARKKAERDRERAIFRKAVLDKYGSEEAALAPCWREKALRQALGSLVINQPEPWTRWTDSIGGVDSWLDFIRFEKVPAAVRAAIETAIPLPATIAEAYAEYQAWRERDREMEAAFNWQAGDYSLDLVCVARMERVRMLLETELRAGNFAELLFRSRYYRDLEMQDNKIEEAIHRDLERLVAEQAEKDAPAEPVQTEHRDSAPEPVQSEHPARASDRRAHVVALLSDPNTAGLSDREIARRCGVSPSTVGALRRRVQTGQFQSEEGWQAAE